MATRDDADLDRIFTDIEKFISSYRASSSMVSMECDQVRSDSFQTTKMAEDWAYLLHNSMLPQITLLPSDLPLVEETLAEQNNLLKIIDQEYVEKSQMITEVSAIL